MYYLIIVIILPNGSNVNVHCLYAKRNASEDFSSKGVPRCAQITG
jgi:hypothetical protein